MAVQPEQIKTLSPLQRLDLIIKSSHKKFQAYNRDWDSNWRMKITAERTSYRAHYHA